MCVTWTSFLEYSLHVGDKWKNYNNMQNDCFIDNHRLFLQSLQKCHNLHFLLKSKHPRLLSAAMALMHFRSIVCKSFAWTPQSHILWVSALETTFINPYKHTKVKIDNIMYAALSSSLHWRVIFWLPQVIYIGATFLYTQVAHLWWTVYYYDLYITISEFCMFFLIWLFL